ncbi:TetR family transcriptional regulator [Kitasatospora purpeofusca]|uniref:TetR/AcrR family transcriptional regulator n=1 Tax=Kitasatospora purpeofusca TaxID=67352 RepID=UPI00224D95BA|nr:TetR family transcriptional regulator [Kitasatospora purpeofusca]MCX4687486.1 TetR family transcriptional regulator [Kitasatospora purpeofusca]
MSAPQSATAPPAGPGNPIQAMLEAPLSLRERKKLKTRQTIRREAYRLIAEQGYENTTVDQIAAAAEVSPSTFFRYFATKEDLVLTDEYDPAMIDALLSRPEGEPFLRSCREALIGLLRQLLEHEREELLVRLRLTKDVPALRARMIDTGNEPQRLYLTALTRRAGVREPTYAMRITAAAIGAATTETVLQWAEGDGTEDIAELVHRTFAILEDGFSRS